MMFIPSEIDAVLMNPYCKMNYASFYIKGLIDVCGSKAKFSFDEFKNDVVSSQCFMFIVIGNDRRVNIAIDFHDDRRCEEQVLRWCDLYSKINVNKLTFDFVQQNNPEDYVILQEKIFNIPPSFGIRFLNLWQTLTICFRLIFHRRMSSKENVKDCLRAYFKRRPLNEYKPGHVDSNYVFFIASIWHKTTAYINFPRANFIKACLRNPNIIFEGGFVDIGYEKDYIKDVNLLMYRDKKIPLQDFIDKTRKSIVVFNNPSVAHCHGWKLAEYLSMGKAILSIPLSNHLPFELSHKKNIFIVNDSYESVYDGLSYLQKNKSLRLALEKEALKYWQDHVKPESVITYILKKIMK